MTLSRPSASLATLLSMLMAVPAPAFSEVATGAPTLRSPPAAAPPFVQLAQKPDDKEKDKDKKKSGKGKPGQKDDKGDGKQGDKGGGRGGPPDDRKSRQSREQPGKDKSFQQKPQGGSDKARQDTWKQKQPQEQQAKDKAQKQQKPDADKARQDALKQKQFQEQQAKDKAQRQRLDADKARQDALKQKQIQEQQAKDKAEKQKLDADKARQDALKQKQIQEQQAKDRAERQRLDADKARQDALKQKQIQEQQAKDKAERQRLDADKARQDALKQKQLQEQQAKEKAARDKREAEARARDRKGVTRKPEKFDRTKADREFEKAREEARKQDRDQRSNDKERWREGSAAKFEKLRRERRERDLGSRRVIIENDKRVIVRKDDRTYIRHDEGERFRRVGRELRRERQKNGALMVVTMGLAGALIYTLQDDQGRVLRRSRKGRDGREVVLYDNRRYYGGSYSTFRPDYEDYDDYVDVPPPRVTIPRDKYIVEYDRASPEDLYETLSAPPLEPLERGYSLDEVRHSYNLLERMRRVDLDAVNFEFGSWEVGADQYPKLERIARAMQRVLDRQPDEVFLIEGHTDAVGSDIDNLSLSDRRAESVAIILSEEFDVPPENLTTQGYGEEHLKVLTEGPSRINRRVSVRRITPLLSRESAYDDRR